MKRALQVALALCLLSLLTAGSALARGTVYIPYAAQVEIGGVTYRTQIWVTNTSEARTRRIETYFIQSLQDGTQRDLEPTVRWLSPGRTIRVETPAALRGMLELFAAKEITVAARLVRVDDDAPLPRGVAIPVVDDFSIYPADTTVHLQGWERQAQGEVVTNFGLLNLGNDSIQCSISAYTAEGAMIGQTAVVSFAARSHQQYDDVLGLLDTGDLTDARVAVTCNMPFFPYATVFQGQNGHVAFMEPSTSVDLSGLSRPGSDEFVYLSDLNWDDTSNIWDGPHRDRSGWDPHAPGGGVGGYKPIDVFGTRYDKGISWASNWGNSHVIWPLGGIYSRLTMVVGMDDEVFGDYEWGIVDVSTGSFIRLERPSDGFRGRERPTQFRIGSGGTVKIFGDGRLLYETPEFYVHRAPIMVDVDVTSVNELRIQIITDHTERRDAPHRNGLSGEPRINRCAWFDLLNLADAKLYRN